MSLNIVNLDRLISHLEGLPEEKFDMQAFYSKSGKPSASYELRGNVVSSCGTAACIAGWIFELDESIKCWNDEASTWLGLSPEQGEMLFEPPGYIEPGRYPLSRAIRTLKHMRSEFLRTGQVVVDWDAPEPAAKAAWAAPSAVERALPEEIVSLLRLAQRSEVSA